MTRKELNGMLVQATIEHEKHYAAWFCGDNPTPETLKKLSQAQENLQAIREKIRQLSKQEAKNA